MFFALSLLLIQADYTPNVTQALADARDRCPAAFWAEVDAATAANRGWRSSEEAMEGDRYIARHLDQLRARGWPGDIVGQRGFASDMFDIPVEQSEAARACDGARFRAASAKMIAISRLLAQYARYLMGEGPRPSRIAEQESQEAPAAFDPHMLTDCALIGINVEAARLAIADNVAMADSVATTLGRAQRDEFYLARTIAEAWLSLLVDAVLEEMPGMSVEAGDAVVAYVEREHERLRGELLAMLDDLRQQAGRLSPENLRIARGRYRAGRAINGLFALARIYDTARIGVQLGETLRKTVNDLARLNALDNTMARLPSTLVEARGLLVQGRDRLLSLRGRANDQRCPSSARSEAGTTYALRLADNMLRRLDQ